MGTVLLVYEIRPEAPEITPQELEKSIRDGLSEKYEMKEKIEEKPLFFGITGIVAQFIIPEEDGAQDELEDYITALKCVSTIQMTFVTRL